MKKKLLIVAGVIVFLLILKLVSTPRSSTTVVKKNRSSSSEALALYEKGVELQKNNDWLEAKTIYDQMMSEHFDFDQIEDVQKRLEDVNMKIILSNVQTPQTVIHIVEKGDSLGKIGQKYNCTIALIKKSNNLKDDTIRLNQRLRIWTSEFSVLVDKSQNTLILKAGDDIVKTYTVSTGENNSTPVGTFVIETKLIDPVWFKSGAIIPPDSPKNVLGTRWMGFDIPGYGIHGTTEPEALGQQVTAGCVRMRNDEVEELYDLLPFGTKVTIVD
ncbi:MAG: L,D-transpeptidase family protein [Candidatus Omnitrophica bacterium]|nr:L,D-transpeptidase family protein [Candidatus Omnitrophota bacterium]